MAMASIASPGEERDSRETVLALRDKGVLVEHYQDPDGNLLSVSSHRAS